MSGLKKYLIICGVFLVIYLLVQYFKPKPTNWTPTYLTEDKIPFGTYILNERIKDIFPGITVKKTQNPICNTLKEKSEGNSNYLIIASELQIYKLDYKEMVNYLRAGNNIFIAAYEINGILRDSLKIKISSDFSLTDNDKYPINFSNTSLRSQKGYYFNKGISQQYFSKIDTSRAIILGTKNNNLTNFFSINLTTDRCLLCQTLNY